MNKYKIITKGTFEGMKKFEERLNKECSREWSVTSMVYDNMQIIVLLQRNE